MISTTVTDLPAARENQRYFTVNPLEAGSLGLRESLFVSDADPEKVAMVPSLSFLLRSSSSPTTAILFDLGIKKDLKDYSPGTQLSIERYFSPCSAQPDTADSLKQHEIEPKDITHVILSHIHWDHIGDHRPFSSAQFIVGSPAKALIENGYPNKDGSGFLQDTVPTDRTTWLQSENWTRIGPFDKALDFFGNGSLYIVDAAGHMPGHINVLVRIDASEKWAYLAGDSAHDLRLLTGEKEIGHFTNSDGIRCCMHEDEATAKQHIERIASLSNNVTVWLAHDPTWRGKVKATH